MEITCYDKYGRVIEKIVQWDVGQSISIKGYDLTSYAPQIHFANANSEKALVVESVLSGGLLSCQVPNSLARENLPIIMYIYDAVGETGKTNTIIKIPVTPRPMPDDVVYTDDVGVISLTEVLRQAREYMNNSLNYSTKAKGSEEKAKTSADAAKVSETNAAKSESTASSSAAQAAQSAKEAKAYVGSPLVANTISAMTDQTKVYVYTGSESGYTAGNWYYHNGSAWVSGGVYNSSAVNVDKTLTQDGYAADAKVTGDAVDSLREDLDAVYSGTKNLKSAIEWFYGAYFDGYFHDNEPGNEVISKPFIPNNLLKLVVRKISDNVDYQIDVCESTYNENDKIVLEGSTNINVLNNTASVGEEGNYEFTTGKTYSIRLLKSPNSSIIITDKTALNYFSIDLIGNGINKNTENITEIEARLVELENKPVNLLPDCSNKKIVLFGDSLFACSNDGGAWGGVLQKHFGFGTYISVGIGGSKFIANGKVALPSDFSVGNSLPKTLVVTSDGTTPCAFSDWTRIDATVPSDADIIIVGTGANDCGYGEYWIKEDSVDMPGFVIDGSIEKTPHTGWDTAWQNSDEYVNYNGDWDRSFLGGAIRSTIMKLQAKAPNAKIFVTNWCNSRGTAGQIGTSTHDAKNTENTLSIMKKICNDFGVELIDLFSDSGINPLNRLQYVKDSIHLTDDGYTKMMAQPIVSAVRNYIMSAYN